MAGGHRSPRQCTSPVPRRPRTSATSSLGIRISRAASVDRGRRPQELEQKAERCVVQLSNAEKLIGGLGGEEKRWKDTVAKLTLAMNNIPGASSDMKDAGTVRQFQIATPIIEDVLGLFPLTSVAQPRHGFPDSFLRM